MAAPRSVNLVAQQTVPSDIGDYADRNDIIQLLNIDLAPYMQNGVWYHRFRIEVSSLISMEMRKAATNQIQTLQTGFHRVWAPRAVSEVRRDPQPD